MKFTLNTEKSPFCSVGSFSFTFGNETQDIDVSSIPDEYKKQLLYNLNRGVLLSDDKKGVASLSNIIQRATPIPQEQIPLQHNKVAKAVGSVVKEGIGEDLKPLKALLRKTVSTIKKEVVDYSPSKVRKLLELERELKNRKSVVNFLVDILEKHQMSVLDSLGNVDGSLTTDPLSVDPKRSTQVTDIVESDVDTVTFSQGLLEQEVL